MEQLQKLYNLYLDAGLISNQVTFDMFSNSTREQQAGLYDAGTRAGFITQTPFEQFETAFVKKNPKANLRILLWKLVGRIHQKTHLLILGVK